MEYVLVGVVDRRWTAVQCGTRLLLLDHERLAEILFYQLALRRFSVIPAIPLAQALPLRQCIRAALDCAEAQWTPSDGDPDDLARRAAAVLMEKSEMLSEYFSLSFSGSSDKDDAQLTTIPELLPGHRPEPQHLGMFLLRLATDTDWLHEKECFRNVALHIANYYSRLAPSDEDDTESTVQSQTARSSAPAPPAIERFVTSTLLPAARTHLQLPTECATDGTVVQVAALEQLYKVFERC
jgi:DNA mismatch repair protein MLH1